MKKTTKYRLKFKEAREVEYQTLQEANEMLKHYKTRPQCFDIELYKVDVEELEECINFLNEILK